MSGNNDSRAATATATILVTDVVGSTALRQRLGEERAESARRDHDRLLADAVERSGGAVVKNLGDGVLGRFASAADAVAAAVRIQQETDVAARRSPDAPVNVRIGLSAGDVTLEDGDCFGAPVVEASRLCAAAASGQVLAAALVQLLARGRGGHGFVPVGELDLKGLDAPVPVVEVQWSPARAADVPLPAALAPGGRLPFTGRDEPVTRVRQTLADVSAGARRVVLVSGEPGVGKTRFVAEVAGTAHGEGGVVLYGRANESVQAPLRPIGTVLDHLLAHVDDDVLDDHLARHGDRLAGLAPVIRERRPDAPPAARSEDERGARFEAAADALRRASIAVPVVIVIDDLHWADHATLHFLRFVAREGSLGRILVLGTYRDTDLVRGHPLAEVLADLRREPLVDRIDLGGLDGPGVLALMAAAAGHELGAAGIELAAAIHRETEGNLFFIGEVLVHLAESGAITERDGRWLPTRAVADIGVPQGIREVVGRRLAALGPGTDEILRPASAIGATFDLGVLAAVVDRAVDDVIALLELGVERGLLVEDVRIVDRFQFVHALVRATLYEELSSSRRVRLHARIADALEAAGGADVATLAHHACEAAIVGDPARALDLAVRAAAEAVDATAIEQVTAWWDRAFEMEALIDPADDGRRAELTLARAIDERSSIELSQVAADRLIEAAALARECGRGDVLAEAAAALAPMATWGSTTPEVALALVDEALSFATDGPLRSRVLQGASTARFGDAMPDARLALSGEALAIARDVDDPTLLLAALNSRCSALAATEHDAEFDVLAAELYTARTDPDIDMFTEMGARFQRLQGLCRKGELDAARSVVDEFFELGEQRGWWGHTAQGHGIAAMLVALQGDISKARAHIAQGYSCIRAEMPIIEVSLRSAELVIHHLVADADGEREAWLAYPEWFAVPLLFPWEGALLELAGDLDEARPRFLAWAELVPFIPYALREISDSYVAWSWRAVPAEAAAPLYDYLDRRRGLWLGTSNVLNGTASLALGRLSLALGRRDGALAHLEAALGEHDEAGEVPHRAHILALLAEVLADRGGSDDRHRARSLADEALEVGTRVGLRRVERDAARILEQLP